MYGFESDQLTISSSQRDNTLTANDIICKLLYITGNSCTRGSMDNRMRCLCDRVSGAEE
jgi:hypothetical protein